MNGFFKTVDKIKPLYDATYNVMLFVCKIFLIADICITGYAVLGRYLGQYVSFLSDPKWSEEVVLTLMAYMAVLSGALAIRRKAHIRMTAFGAGFTFGSLYLKWGYDGKQRVEEINQKLLFSN